MRRRQPLDIQIDLLCLSRVSLHPIAAGPYSTSSMFTFDFLLDAWQNDQPIVRELWSLSDGVGLARSRK